MSWQDYVDTQLIGTKCVKQAAITGLDGNVWAKSENFNITQEEILKIIQGFQNPSILQKDGITVSGTRYVYLSGSDNVLRAKKNKVGLHCMKTNKALVISVYEDPIQPQQAALVVERLGDYLIRLGYPVAYEKYSEQGNFIN